MASLIPLFNYSRLLSLKSHLKSWNNLIEATIFTRPGDWASLNKEEEDEFSSCLGLRKVKIRESLSELRHPNCREFSAVLMLKISYCERLATLKEK